MLAFLAAFLVQGPSVDSTPIPPISQLVHTKWSTRDGAPAGVRALAQTNDGYLWIGAARGLFRFDGVRFVAFVPPDSALRNAAVRRLVASRRGGLWVVWGLGKLSRLHDGRWSTWAESEGLPSTIDVAESSTGTVVAGTVKGLWRLEGTRWHDATREWQFPGSQSQSVWYDRDDGLWSQAESRLMHMPRGARGFAGPGLPLFLTAVPAQFAQERDGTIWMTELYRSTHTIRRPGDRVPETEVDLGGWTTLVDRRGSVWIGSLGDGVRRISDPARLRGQVIPKFGAQAESFTTRNGLLADLVYAMLEDRDGSIWIGTSLGIERLSAGAFQSIVTPGGARERRVYATRDSAVWISTLSMAGILRLDPSTGRMEQFGRHIPFAVYEDRSGAVWMVNGQETFTFGKRQRHVSANAYARNDAKTLRAVTMDSAGTVWFVDEAEGLMRIAGDSLVKVASLPPSVGTPPALLSGKGGRLWIMQGERLLLYEHDKLTSFDPSSGHLPPGLRHVFEDRAGNLWVISAAGISRLDGTRFETIAPERRGIPEWAVTGVTQDLEGAWWFATRTGVLRLPAGEIERALEDTSHVLRYRLFDERDGVSTPAVSITTAADGRIWVGTSSGVASIDPRSVANSTVPPVMVEGVRVDDTEMPPMASVRIPPNGRDFEIDYTSTALGMADRIQFRYRLEGADPGWREVGSRRRAYYSSLAPGHYTFHVTASNGDGKWNDVPAVLGFRVLPAWYQTSVFQGGVVLLILGLGATVSWMVQRQRQHQMREVLTSQHQATLAERTRLAGELHDTLLQAFTGVTLQLQGLRRRILSTPQDAEHELGRMLKLADVALRDARSAVWDLRAPGLEDTDVATALEESARQALASHRDAGGAPVELEVKVTGARRRLSPAVETCAHRIGREALSNALRHADARHISVAIDFEVRHLCVDVRDDGVGFDTAQLNPTEGRGHWGLVGMSERARNARGTLNVTSAPGSGTRIVLRVPLEPT